VELVRSSGRTLREVGRELGVNHETLRNWVNAAKRAEQTTVGGADRSEEVSPGEGPSALTQLRNRAGSWARHRTRC
jgi:transposase